MDKYEKRVFELMEEVGAQFLRTGKHDVYSLPNGNIFTLPLTPSDRRAQRNQLSDLKRRLRETHDRREVEVPVKRERREARFVVPNWEQHEHDTPIAIPKSGAPVPIKQQHVVRWGDKDVVKVLENQESFWRLSPCGRVRFIVKMLQQNTCHFRIIGVRTSKLYAGEIESVNPKPTPGLHISREELSRRVSARLSPCHPAILLQHPKKEDSDLVIDPTAEFEVLGTPKLVRVDVTQRDKRGVTACRHVKEQGIDLVYLSVFDNELFKFSVDAEWTDPKLIRPAFREYLDSLSADWRDRNANAG